MHLGEVRQWGLHFFIQCEIISQYMQCNVGKRVNIRVVKKTKKQKQF